MKRNISITIDETIVKRINNYANEFDCSRSKAIEIIVKNFLDSYDRVVKGVR